MKIGIVGMGQIDSSVIRGLTAVGHEVFIANSRGPQTVAELAAETHACAVTPREAARAAEVVPVS